MIDIYTDKKDSKDWILQNDLYFNLNTSNEEMSSNEINLIQQVDEAKLTPDKHIETKYGLGTIRNLSSGCKTLLNIVKHPDKVVNVEECGPNVLKIIFTMDNIKIYMSRPSLFDIPDDVQIRFNDSDIVTGGRGYNACHRCPQLHLELSNRLVDKNEKQKSEKDSGQLSVYYESEIDCHTLIERQKYDLMYISQKQGVYETHDYKKNNIRENLAEELEPLLFENHPTKDAQTVKKVAYYYAGKMIEKYRSTREKKDAMTLLSNWEKIDSRRYGIIINLFEDESPIKQEDKIFVKSIDYIKGMEGEKCLFILTNDLAAHLFNNNTEMNKTKNKLYVALTRSLNELSIYILKEVEDKYTKKRIQDFFERYL